MELTKKLINENIHKFDGINYYNLHIDKIEKNIFIYPDVTIESCKSLVEWICKTIILKLSPWINQAGIKKLDNTDFVEIFKDAIEKLSDKCDIEPEFSNLYKNTINKIGKIRNNRWDLSHWKSIPKNENSSPEFALFISRYTDSFLSYILEYFFNLDLSYLEVVNYEDNEEFNNSIDDDQNLVWISYSEALYYQDYNLYYEKLENYLDENGLLENKEETFEYIQQEINIQEDIQEYDLSKAKKIININVNKEFYSQNLITEDWFKKLANQTVEFEKIPLDNEIIIELIKKPSLSERKTILDTIKNELKNYI